MKTVRRPTYSFLILVIGLIIINALLAWFSVAISRLISPSLPSGVAVIYIAAAFMVIFTLWFGMYGAIAAYVGCFFGAGLLSGMPATVAIYFSLADLWMVLIPLAAFRIFDVNVGMESGRDLFHLVLFGVILNNVIAAAWGSIALAMGGMIKWNDVLSTFLLWLIGNAIIIIIIAPLVLRRFTPRVAKSKVFVKNYWF
jgi:flagellar biosynthesis protein FlhB